MKEIGKEARNEGRGDRRDLQERRGKRERETIPYHMTPSN